jgi:nicotinamidase-related amidase
VSGSHVKQAGRPQPARLDRVWVEGGENAGYGTAGEWMTIVTQALLIVDVQPTFPMPIEMLHEIRELSSMLPSVATVERHDESVTPFERQLSWKPGVLDESLVEADRVFIKHGYLPPPEAIDYLRALRMDRILVCGVQADTCVLAAGFALFDAGLRPTLLKWLTVGSSLDRSGDLGARLWRHHFGSVLERRDQLGILGG